MILPLTRFPPGALRLDVCPPSTREPVMVIDARADPPLKVAVRTAVVSPPTGNVVTGNVAGV
jgi:hypothetical protein